MEKSPNLPYLVWKENRWFLIPFLVIEGVMLGYCLYYQNWETHLYLNRYRSHFLNVFMPICSLLGTGLPCYIGMALLFWRFRTGLFVLLSQGVAFVLTQPIKFSVNAPRPVQVFSEMGLDLPTVEGIALSTSRSFPSGHTSAAFALCMCLSLLLPKKYAPLKFLCLLAALLCAWSRIYLSQHFLEDTVAGAPIGVISAMMVYIILYKREWGEVSILHWFTRKKTQSPNDAHRENV